MDQPALDAGQTPGEESLSGLFFDEIKTPHKSGVILKGMGNHVSGRDGGIEAKCVFLDVVHPIAIDAGAYDNPVP